MLSVPAGVCYIDCLPYAAHMFHVGHMPRCRRTNHSFCRARGSWLEELTIYPTQGTSLVTINVQPDEQSLVVFFLVTGSPLFTQNCRNFHHHLLYLFILRFFRRTHVV